MSSNRYFADAQVTHQVTTTTTPICRRHLAPVESFWETTIIGIPLIATRSLPRRQKS